MTLTRWPPTQIGIIFSISHIMPWGMYNQCRSKSTWTSLQSDLVYSFRQLVAEGFKKLLSNICPFWYVIMDTQTNCCKLLYDKVGLPGPPLFSLKRSTRNNSYYTVLLLIYQHRSWSNTFPFKHSFTSLSDTIFELKRNYLR